jgi:hypothetical protein
MNITFTDTIGVPEEYRPIPASKIIPDWYKDLESYIGGEKRPDGSGGTTTTAKKCMPIFDSMNAGYIILTHTDLYVSQVEHVPTGKTIQHYEWAKFGAIAFHPKPQLPEHPLGDGHELAYPKWTNAWAITTPPGYSSLFIPPVHRETPILALSGLVDTDTYKPPVNFPFVLKNPKMQGIIPAGTPIVQVIPIKRDKWKMQIGGEKEFIEQSRHANKLGALFFDSYKRQYRQPKEYR